MKNKKFFIINALIAVLLIAIMTLFLVFLDINRPGGIILYILMFVISLGALFWFTYFASFKEIVPESFVLFALPTYIFQLAPIIIFFLASDRIVESKLIMFPILLIIIFTIAYLAFIFLYSHYNKKAVAHEKMTEATANPVQDEKEYYNDDGSFKGL